MDSLSELKEVDDGRSEYASEPQRKSNADCSIIECAAEVLATTYGYPREGSLVAALAIQASVLGPSYDVIVPTSIGTVTGAVNLLLIGGSLGVGFNDLTASIRQTLGGYSDPYRRLTHTKKRMQRLFFEDRVAELEESISKKTARLKVLRCQDPGHIIPNLHPVSMEDPELEQEIAAETTARTETLFELDRLAFSIRPLLTAPNLTIEMFNNWTSKVFDGGLAVVQPNPGGLRNMLALSAHDRLKLTTFVDAAQDTGYSVTGQAEPARAQIQYVLGCSTQEASDFLSSTLRDCSATRGSFISIEGAADSSIGDDPLAPNLLPAWILYLNKLCKFRIEKKHKQLGCTPGAGEMFVSFQRECLARAGELPDEDWRSSHLRYLPKLALALALGLHIGRQEGDGPAIPEATLAKGIDLARAVSEGHLGRLREPLAEESIRDSRSPRQQIERLTEKIRKLGACSKRDLFRSYHRQAGSQLEPILTSAMEAGLVFMTGDGKYAASAMSDDNTGADTSSDCQRVSASAEL